MERTSSLSRKLMHATDKSSLIPVCVSASVHFHQTRGIDNQHPFRANVFAIAYQRVN